MRIPASSPVLTGLLCGLLLAQAVLAQGAIPTPDRAQPAQTAAPALTAAPTPTAPDSSRPDELHEHGMASLGIRVEGDRLDLRLRVPLHTVLGAESSPRTEKQRQAVRRMAAALRAPHALFVPTPAAGCTAGEVTLRSDAIRPELLGAAASEAQTVHATTMPTSGPPADIRRKAATPAHADLEADFPFRCDKPQSLTGLQVLLFAAFPSLRQVDAVIVTPRGDSGARLSPNRTSLTW